MPVPPYTWQLKDYLTASRLNQELYLTNGAQFQPNGIAWHAAKPIYRSSQISTQGVLGIWQQQGAPAPVFDQSFCVQIDTAALFGARVDVNMDGTIFYPALGNSGGAIGQSGGIGLVSVFTPFTSGGGRVDAGLGWDGGSSPGSSYGTRQPANAGFAACPFAVDLMDLHSPNGHIVGYFNSNQTTPSIPVPKSDGSGQSPRLQAHWVSVYPANGAAVASNPAPIASWSGTSTLTSAIANGSTFIPATMNLLNMPPILRNFTSGSTQAISTSTATAITSNWTSTPTYDTYTAWSGSTYTVPLKGLYLVYGCIPWASATGSARAGARINGTDYWGPYYSMGGAVSSSAKLQVFSLNAGDTIQLSGWQNSGGTVHLDSGSSEAAILLVAWLGQSGAASPLPSVPDVTFSYQAGTPGSTLVSQFNAHLSNDLLFLLQHPYFLGYQGTVQTGIAQSTATTVTLDNIHGIVHGDAGDPWSGWNSGGNDWVAPVNGYYLVTSETFMAAPSLTTDPNNIALLALSVNGIANNDWYQQNHATGSAGCGAAAIGYYYLRAGDTIKSQVSSNATSATTTATDVANGHSHMEIVWLGV